MTFEGQYLTYAEYQELGGSAIGEMPFNILEFEARRQIDSRTQNRLVKIETIPQEVKICMFNLINTIKCYSNDNDRIKASERVGSYSVDYKDNIAQVIENKDAELDNIILTELYGLVVNGEHILYIGVE
jgi:hypothetical protein